jgi:hypothetical protein
VANGTGGFDVRGSHSYTADGSFTFTVTVQSAGGTASASAKATVVDAALTATGVPVTVPAIGSTGSVVVATFTDAGGPEPVAAYTATIDWGDGSPSSAGTVTVVGNTFTVAGSHNFLRPGQFTATVTVSDQGGSSVKVTAGILAGQPNQVFVTQAYEDVLHRVPDATSLAYWGGMLDQGMTPGQVAAALTHSDEYYANMVRDQYQRFLGRSADAGGVNFWVAQMRQGLSDEQLQATFVGSPEYYAFTGATDRKWVDGMYHDLLGRPPDQAGENYWVQVLAAGADRETVAYGFAASLEREQMRVQDDYQSFLARPANAAEVDFWVNGFASGGKNEDVVAGFVGSTEYYLRVTGHA